MCPEDGNLSYIVAVLVSDYAIYFQSYSWNAAIQHNPLSPHWILIVSLWAEDWNQWFGFDISTHVTSAASLSRSCKLPVFPRVCLVLTPSWIELQTACQEDCGLSPEDRFSEGGSVSLDLSLTYPSLNQLCRVVVLVSLVEFRVKQLSLAGEEQPQAHLVTWTSSTIFSPSKCTSFFVQLVPCLGCLCFVLFRFLLSFTFILIISSGLGLRKQQVDTWPAFV